MSLVSGLDKISLNAREIVIKEITVDDAVSEFTYIDPRKVALEKITKAAKEADSHPVHYHSTYRNEVLDKANYELIVKLDSLKAENSIILVRIGYCCGDPVSQVLFSRLNKESTYCDQIVMASRDLTARYMFPCLDSITDICEWELIYILHEHSEEYSVVSTGEFQSKVKNEDGKYQYRFVQEQRCSASNIMAVLGVMQSCGIHRKPICTAYSHPSKFSKVRYTLEVVPKIFDFYAWFLGGHPSPYLQHDFVFVKDLPHPVMDGAGITLLSVNYMHEPTIIDKSFEVRIVLAEAIARQLFSVYVFPASLADIWLTLGISRYLSLQCYRILFGNNEYKFRVKKEAQQIGSLDVDMSPLCFDYKSLKSMNLENIALKSGVVFSVLQQHLSKAFLQKVILCLLEDCRRDEYAYGFSTVDFIKIVKKTTGKDLKAFYDHWIYGAGVPSISCSFVLNRKSNVIEFSISQVNRSESQEAILRFSGGLTIRVYEADGTFDHKVQLDSATHNFELPFHTKNRKIRKKKKAETKDLDDEEIEEIVEEEPEVEEIPPEEGGDDISSLNSPILWIRVDPENEWLMNLYLEQPDFMWIEQLENDRDVAAQYEAILALENYSSSATCFGLERILKDPKTFYRVRAEAAYSLAACHSFESSELLFLGANKLVKTYSKRYCHPGNKIENIPKPNNFDQMASYFVQKSIIQGLSFVDQEEGHSPEFVTRFILTILKNNDNSKNPFSDSSFVSACLNSLAQTLCGNPQTIQKLGYPDQSIIDEVLEEMERYRILDLLFPSFQNEITCAVIQSLARMQYSGLCEYKRDFYLLYSRFGNFINVRLAAIESLFLLYSDDVQVIDYMLELLRYDEQSVVREHVLKTFGIVSRSKVFPLCAFNDRKDEILQLLNSLRDESIFSKFLDFMEFTFLPMDAELDSGDRMPIIVLPNIRPPKGGKVVEEAEPVIPKITLPKLVKSAPIPKIVLPKLVKEEAVPKAVIPPALNSASIPSDVAVVKDIQMDLNPSKIKLKIKAPTSPIKLKLSIKPENESKGPQFKILKKLMSQKKSSFFNIPVDPVALNIPDYFNIIKEPMDFSTILQKVKDGKYKDDKAFENDVYLVFRNCFRFNPKGGVVYTAAVNIQEVFEADWECATEFRTVRVLDEMTAQKFSSLVMKYVKNPEATPFVQRVDPTAFPKYYDIIRKPMDLSTISSKLQTGVYPTVEGILDDFRLIFDNCRLFSASDAPICLLATKLEQEIFAEIEKMEIKLVGASEKEICQNVLNLLWEHPLSAPFLQPVDYKGLNLPDYPRKVKRPMDLSTLKTNLEDMKGPNQFVRDCRLIFSNCCLFNGPASPLSKMALSLDEFFVTHIEKYFPSIKFLPSKYIK